VYVDFKTQNTVAAFDPYRATRLDPVPALRYD
jgi:hypothetical protein